MSFESIFHSNGVANDDVAEIVGALRIGYWSNGSFVESKRENVSGAFFLAVELVELGHFAFADDKNANLAVIELVKFE